MNLQYLLHKLHQRKILEQTQVFMKEEGDVDLNIVEVLEDIGVCESNDEINPDHFVF